MLDIQHKNVLISLYKMSWKAEHT